MHELGLRERKRAATRKAIQLAVLELSIANGFEHVTIDDIGRAAQVSPRTFFNYFTSKEDAVTGGSEKFAPPAALVERFLHGSGRVLDDVIDLIIEVIPENDDLDVHRLRRKLMKREPSLLGRQIVTAHVFEDALHALIVERLLADVGGAETVRDKAALEAVREQARLLSLVAVAVAKHGWTRWVSADGRRSLPDLMRQSHLDFTANFCSAGSPRGAAAHVPQLASSHAG